MNQAALMRVLQPQRRLPRQFAGCGNRQRPALLDILGQRHTIEKVHHQPAKCTAGGKLGSSQPRMQMAFFLVT
jgi:hypothetical protein